MTKHSFTQRLGNLIDGSDHPRWVAWAVVLGLAAGFVCGWNLTLAAILLVAALVNVHTRSFIACWAAGVVLAWWLDPVTSRLGYVLLDGTPLGRAIGSLGNHPLVVLLGWDHYDWIGGLALSLLLGWPLSNAAARWTVRRRAMLAARLHDGSCLTNDPLDQLVSPVVPRPGLLERAAGRALFGPMPPAGAEPPATTSSKLRDDTRSQSAQADKPHTIQLASRGGSPQRQRAWPSATSDLASAARPIFRPLGWSVAAVLAAMTGLLAYGVGPVLLRQAVLEHLAAFNTATVDAARFDVSLWDGHFEIEGLRFADPADLNYNRFVIARAMGTLDAGRLLRGWLDIHSIGVDGVYFHTQRETPAEPVLDRITISRAGSRLATASLNLPSDKGSESTITIDDQLAVWPRLQARLSIVEAVLEQLQHLRRWDASLSPAHAHFALLAYPWKMRSSLGHNEPLVAVRRMRIEHLSEPASLGPRGVIEVAHLNSRDARGGGGTARVTVVVPHVALEVEATLHLADPEPVHTLRVRAYDLDLASLIAAADPANNYVRINSGRIDLAGQGTFGPHGIDLPLKVDARQLVVRISQLDRLAGLRRETWNAGFARVGRLGGDVRLEGPWKATRLLLDPQAVVLQLKHQLRAAGEHQLVSAIEADLNSSGGVSAVAGDPGAAGDPASPAASTAQMVASPRKQAASRDQQAGSNVVSRRDEPRHRDESVPTPPASVAWRRPQPGSPSNPAPAVASTTPLEPADRRGSTKEGPSLGSESAQGTAATSAGGARRPNQRAVSEELTGTIKPQSESPSARPARDWPPPIDWQIGYDEDRRTADGLPEQPHAGSRPADTLQHARADVSRTSTAEAYRAPTTEPPFSAPVDEGSRTAAAKASGGARPAPTSTASRGAPLSRQQHATLAESSLSADPGSHRQELAIGYEDRFAPHQSRRQSARAIGNVHRATPPALRVPIDRSATAQRTAIPPLPERRSALAGQIGFRGARPWRLIEGTGQDPRRDHHAPLQAKPDRSITATDPWMWPKRTWRRVARVFSRRLDASAPIVPPDPIGPPVPAAPWTTLPPESVGPPETGLRVAVRPDPPAKPTPLPDNASHESGETWSARSRSQMRPARTTSDPMQKRKWYERLWR